MMPEESFTLVHAFEDYFASLCGALIFVFFCGKNQFLAKRLNRYFFHAGVMLILLVLAEMGDRYFSGFSTTVVFRTITSAMGYCIKPLFGLVFLMIVGRHIKKRSRIILAIPAAFNSFLCILNLFVPNIIFSFNENNLFVRGETALAYFPFFASAFYIFLIPVLSFRHLLKRQKEEALVSICFAAVCIVASVVEVLGHPHGVLMNASLLAMYFYYVCMMLNRYTHDQLTGVLLRSRFFYDTEHVSKDTYVVSMDINGLKLTNDKQGHAAGDLLLSRFAECVFTHLPATANFYRIGGDEFSILYRTSEEKNVKNLIKEIKDSCNKEGVTFAAGYEMFNSGAGFERAFAVADQRMYEDKRKYYAKKIGGGFSK